MNTQSSNGCCEKCFEGEPARVCGDSGCPCHQISVCNCPKGTTHGLGGFSVCPATKPSPEEWEKVVAVSYEPQYLRVSVAEYEKMKRQGTLMEVKEVQETLTADRERLVEFIRGKLTDMTGPELDMDEVLEQAKRL